MKLSITYHSLGSLDFIILETTSYHLFPTGNIYGYREDSGEIFSEAVLSRSRSEKSAFKKIVC